MALRESWLDKTPTVVRKPPIMPFKDPAYTVAYPENGDWRTQLNAERVLVLATLFLANLIREFGNPAEMELIRKSMQALDGEIARSLAELEASISPCRSSFHKKVALIRLHSARIKVHHYCALLDDDSAPGSNMDDPFRGSAPATSTASGNIVPNSSSSIASSSSPGRHFPFSSALSLRYCLESAGVNLQTLPDLSQVNMAGTDYKFYTFTPFACPIILAGYTFLMLRQKVDNYGSPTEYEPGSRSLLSECEHGAASCVEVLDGFSQAWIHLEDAAMHMKEAAKSLEFLRRYEWGGCIDVSATPRSR
ncbi:hypothetical protein LA080_014665 [Diaporthe eres]|nr:hypothetical protein LA080_014665 [Diaporthe eres]